MTPDAAPVFECFPTHGNWVATDESVIPWPQIKEFRFYVDGALRHQTPFDMTINYATYDATLTPCQWHSDVLEIPLGEHNVTVSIVLFDGTESDQSVPTTFRQYIGSEPPTVLLDTP